MKFPPRCHWPIVIALLVLTGCQSAPLKQAEPGARYAPESDEAGLRFAMDEAEDRLRQSPLRIRDAALEAYVGDIVCRLAGDFCPEIRVYLIDLPYANASMAPNGVLQIWAGLLLRAHDEAEIAYVIGHELGHYRHRHVIQQWRSAQRTQALLGALQVMTAGVGAGLVGGVLSLGGNAALSQFSRAHEREADRFGFQSLVAEGYDPNAATGLYEQLAAEEAALPPRWRSVVFASHPPTAERLADMRAAASASGLHAATRGERFEDRYVRAVAAHRREWIEADLSRRQVGPSRVLIDALLRRAAPSQKAELNYFRGEVARLDPASEPPGAAERWYREAIAAPGAPAAAHRELGLLLRSRNQRAAAARELTRYLELAADPPDRALIQHYIDEVRA